MPGLFWALLGVVAILMGLAFAAWLLNMPIVLIASALAIALLIVFLLVTRGSGKTSPVAGPAEPAPTPPAPTGTTAGGPPRSE